MTGLLRRLARYIADELLDDLLDDLMEGIEDKIRTAVLDVLGVDDDDEPSTSS